MMAEADDLIPGTPASTTEQQPPRVDSLSDFTSLRESFGDDGSGGIRFRFTKFVLVDGDSHAAWIGALDVPKKQVTVDQAVGSLVRVPDHDIYPAATPDLPLFAAAEYVLAEDTWLKRPNAAVYSQVAGTSIIADDFIREVKTYQLLRKRPHPRLAEFRGCLEKGGRIVGILLKRYPVTLSTRVGGRQSPLDCGSCMQGIAEGVAHLHSLGLAHNDLNPRNIMLDEQDRPVIIDMGSCLPLGEELHQMGTPGWNDGFEEISSTVNDQVGFWRVREWLLAGGGEIDC